MAHYKFRVKNSLFGSGSSGLGYKEVSWGAVKIKGETLALSASAPIGSGIGIYGTGGIGWLSTLVPTYSNTATDYALGDFGLSYSFNNKPVSLTSLSATVGYRYQQVTTKTPPWGNHLDNMDTTSGLTLGIIGRF